MCCEQVSHSVNIQRTLGAYVRTYNCLKKANILTVGELVGTTEADLMQIRNFGKKSLIEVREKLQFLGLGMKGGATISTDDVEDTIESPEEDQA